MTLPPNCLPPENAALPADLIAGLGQSAAVPSGGQPSAPFADLLAGAAPATPLPPAVEAPSQPAVNAAPVMYSSHCYTTLLQPAVLGEAPASPDEPVAEIVAPDAEPATEDKGALLLAYQLIAGQWVPQPITPPSQQSAQSQEILCESTEAAISGNILPQTAGIVRGAGFGPQKNSTPSAVSDVQGRVPSGNDFASTTTQPDKTAVAPVAQDRLPKAPEAGNAGNTAPTIPSACVGTTKTPVATTIANTPKLELPAAAATTLKSGDTSADVAKESIAPNVASETAAVTVTDNSNGVLATSLAQPSRPANMTSVKFAAPGSGTPAETAPGVISPNGEQERKTVVADLKGVKSTGRQIGTGAAIREYSMPYSAANKTSAPSVTALPQSLQTGGMQSDTPAPVAETSSASSIQAPRLVQEIRAIADRISTIDRNTVEVRFDFNESDRLSVRVEYRDGTVHTTFRTDSESLRETIAREWQVQASGAENRAYRVAEPIFSSNHAAASTDLSQSGLGSGQSHSRSSEHQASSNFAGHGQPGRSASGSSSTTSGSSVPSVRPETSLHLHTFA